MTITLTREEVQSVLDALELAAEEIYCFQDDDPIGIARKTLRARLSAPEPVPTNNGRYLTGYGAQPEPEPVAWFTEDHREDKSATTYSKKMAERWKEKGWPVTPLYTAPPQRDVLGPVPCPVAWKDAAIRIGEELSSVGPDGYYNMTPQQWLDWALDQQPRGKDFLPLPPCKTGSQCIGGKCPQCVVPEPVGWIYEDDEGRMMFSQMPQNPPLWEPVYRGKQEKNNGA
jgi:hypothetical protein